MSTVEKLAKYRQALERYKKMLARRSERMDMPPVHEPNPNQFEIGPTESTLAEAVKKVVFP